MKKNYLSLILFVFSLGFLLVNCSDDSTESVIYNDTESFTTKSLQSGINIGYVDQNGNDLVYNDSVAFIKTQWERNYNTTITSFSIEKQLTIPDPDVPGDQGGVLVYLLIGKTSSGSHIATSVEPVIDLTFVNLFFKTTEPASLTIECAGCVEGCHIATMNGKGISRYTCKDPCATCSKKETLTNAPF